MLTDDKIKELPAQRKTLYLISGSGGSGKTTLAGDIARRCGGLHHVEDGPVSWAYILNDLTQDAQCVVVDGVDLVGCEGRVLESAYALGYRVIRIDMDGKPVERVPDAEDLALRASLIRHLETQLVPSTLLDKLLKMLSHPRAGAPAGLNARDLAFAALQRELANMVCLYQMREEANRRDNGRRYRLADKLLCSSVDAALLLIRLLGA